MGKRNKTTQSSTQTIDQTTQRTNPAWVTSGIEGLFGKVQNVGERQVAGFTPLQTQAADGAHALGADRGWFEKLMAAPAPRASAASLLDGFDRYEHKYKDQVLDSAMADFDHNAGKTRAQLDLEMAGAQAFGGSGAALARSHTEGELARGRNTAVSALLDEMFKTSAGLASQDADRRQGASIANAQLDAQHAALLGQLGLGVEASNRANVETQAGLGEMLRQIEQQRLDAPLTTLQQQIALTQGLPLELFSGEHTKGTQTGTGTSKSKGFGIGWSGSSGLSIG